MNYFKPEKYYYIIPILKIDLGLIVKDNKCLYEYVKENFPILRQLDDEGAEILYGDELPRFINEKYIDHKKIIKDSLNYLHLPKHILAIGDENEAIEPVTGIKIKERVKDNITLKTYRVSDCELEEYFINNYESKVNNFFNPDVTTIEEAKKSKEDFVSTIEKNRIRNAIVKRKKIINKMKGMKNNDN